MTKTMLLCAVVMLAFFVACKFQFMPVLFRLTFVVINELIWASNFSIHSPFFTKLKSERAVLNFHLGW